MQTSLQGLVHNFCQTTRNQPLSAFTTSPLPSFTTSPPLPSYPGKIHPDHSDRHQHAQTGPTCCTKYTALNFLHPAIMTNGAAKRLILKVQNSKNTSFQRPGPPYPSPNPPFSVQKTYPIDTVSTIKTSQCYLQGPDPPFRVQQCPLPKNLHTPTPLLLSHFETTLAGITAHYILSLFEFLNLYYSPTLTLGFTAPTTHVGGSPSASSLQTPLVSQDFICSGAPSGKSAPDPPKHAPRYIRTPKPVLYPGMPLGQKILRGPPSTKNYEIDWHKLSSRQYAFPFRFQPPLPFLPLTIERQMRPQGRETPFINAGIIKANK